MDRRPTSTSYIPSYGINSLTNASMPHHHSTLTAYSHFCRKALTGATFGVTSPPQIEPASTDLHAISNIAAKAPPALSDGATPSLHDSRPSGTPLSAAARRAAERCCKSFIRSPRLRDLRCEHDACLERTAIRFCYSFSSTRQPGTAVVVDCCKPHLFKSIERLACKHPSCSHREPR